MLKYNNNLTLSKGGLDIRLKVGILAEIGYMLHECAVVLALGKSFPGLGPGCTGVTGENWRRNCLFLSVTQPLPSTVT